MQKQSIPINPSLLQWARHEAGLTPEEAVGRAKITAPRKRKDQPALSPEQRLLAWERGEMFPSLNQLKQIAKAYHRPLITFFLTTPPLQDTTLVDFRTIHGTGNTYDSPEFAALKRRIILLHKELLTLAMEEGVPQFSFVGSATLETPTNKIVASIRETIGISFEEQVELRAGVDLLRQLRDLAQQAGIYVLFEGNLGSHHSNISPEEFRGIALAHPVVPVIIVNPNDAKAAQLFTFIHELAHIWIGNNAVSNGALWEQNDFRNEEKKCNAVAAELLVPESIVQQVWPTIHSGNNEKIRSVDELAKYFKVSGAVAGRRLLDLNYITTNEYAQLMSVYGSRWQKNKERQRLVGGGPNRNTLDRYRLGAKTIQVLVNAAESGRISHQEAARLMNVPVSRFEKVCHDIYF